MFHDNKIVELKITKNFDNCFIEIRMLDYETGQPVIATFPNPDWISANIIGIVSNEGYVYSILELDWSEVPDIYNVNGHSMKFYEIKLCGGSSCRIISFPMLVG